MEAFVGYAGVSHAAYLCERAKRAAVPVQRWTRSPAPRCVVCERRWLAPRRHRARATPRLKGPLGASLSSSSSASSSSSSDGSSSNREETDHTKLAPVQRTGEILAGDMDAGKQCSSEDENIELPEETFREYLVTAFKRNPIDRDILRLALPAVGALALDPLVALADTALIGRLGSIALGGVGISNNVFNLSFTVFNFLGMATTPTIAQHYGRGDLAKASRTIARGLWISATVGLVAMALLSVASRQVVAFFGANELVAPQAVRYLRMRLIAAPFFLGGMVCQGAFRGFQDTQTPFLMAILANTVNLSLFPLLIFGAGMGVQGAGLATALSQITLTSGLFILLVKKKMLNLTDLFRVPEFAKLIPMLRTGAILSVRTFSILSTVSLATATAARMGNVESAAFEVTRQVWALFARLLDAVSVAAQSLIPVELGKKKYVRARQVSRRLLQVGFLLGLLFCGILQGLGAKMASIFSRDPAVVAMIAACFPLMAFFEPLNGLVFVLDGCFTAGRQFVYLAGAIFTASVCAWSALYVTRALNLGLLAVWASLNLMMVLRCILLGVRYYSKASPVPKRKDG
ncbi:Protein DETOXIFICATION 43 [Porphyridium purpureum]|uniref:Protein DETOXIFICATION 43 n=1 Tax=Porphyridium purpureum TaxID=35688 RepID=A0A5J4Z3E4_PORPP|nr:Protein DETOXIFICATION 43 [Porphyridium purpureum]|eukprot:POR2320..scf295_1